MIRQRSLASRGKSRACYVCCERITLSTNCQAPVDTCSRAPGSRSAARHCNSAIAMCTSYPGPPRTCSEKQDFDGLLSRVERSTEAERGA
jgi:hypothetical protein